MTMHRFGHFGRVRHLCIAAAALIVTGALFLATGPAPALAASPPPAAVCTTDGTATVVLSDDGGDVYPAEIGADAIRAVRTGIAC